MHFFRAFSKIKGYRCYDPSQKKIYVSRDVIFIKNTFYYPATCQEEDDFNLYFQLLWSEYTFSANKFLKLESSPLLINFFPPLLRICMSNTWCSSAKYRSSCYSRWWSSKKNVLQNPLTSSHITRVCNIYYQWQCRFLVSKLLTSHNLFNNISLFICEWTTR